MDEKYFFGLIGIVLGSFFSAIFSIARDLYTESRSKKKEAEYLAIRMICTFESFAERCATVVSDDGLFHGQTDVEGYSRVQVPDPELDIQLKDVDWKALPPKLMYEILYFPNLIKEAKSYIDGVFEYSASPPDFSEGFEERQYQYARLGISASELVTKLRGKYKIPKNTISNLDSVQFMLQEKNKIEELRLKREVAHKEMLATVKS